MDLRNLREMPPEELIEVLFTWYQALRRLGFTRDEIHAVPKILDAPSGFVGWGLSVQAQGKEFNVTVGSTTEADDAFTARWIRFAESEQTKLTDTEMRALWDRHMPLQLFTELAEGLYSKGFQLTPLSN